MIIYERGFTYFWHRVFQFKGSVFPKSVAIALPCALTTFALKAMIDSGTIEALNSDGAKSILKDNSCWSGFVFLVGFLTVFRTSQAYARFWDGCTAMHKMRAEWFDACAALVSFCKYTTASEEATMRFQHILIRLFSMLHAVALAEIEDTASQASKSAFFHYELVDAAALDQRSLRTLKHSDSKPELVFSWIQQLIVENIDNKVLRIPPPILSRSFQEIANGMSAYQDAMKITRVPFPFPYAQTCESLLLLHWLCTPLVVSQYVSTPWWGALFSFLQVFVYWSLNAIAVEIENPFGCDANDIDTVAMQKEMNRHLLLLVDPSTKRVPRLASDVAAAFVDGAEDHHEIQVDSFVVHSETTLSVDAVPLTSFPSFEDDSDNSSSWWCFKCLRKHGHSSGERVARIDTTAQAALASRGPVLPRMSVSTASLPTTGSLQTDKAASGHRQPSMSSSVAASSAAGAEQRGGQCGPSGLGGRSPGAQREEKPRAANAVEPGAQPCRKGEEAEKAEEAEECGGIFDEGISEFPSPPLPLDVEAPLIVAGSGFLDAKAPKAQTACSDNEWVTRLTELSPSTKPLVGDAQGYPPPREQVPSACTPSSPHQRSQRL